MIQLDEQHTITYFDDFFGSMSPSFQSAINMFVSREKTTFVEFLNTVMDKDILKKILKKVNDEMKLRDLENCF